VYNALSPLIGCAHVSCKNSYGLPSCYRTPSTPLSLCLLSGFLPSCSTSSCMTPRAGYSCDAASLSTLTAASRGACRLQHNERQRHQRLRFMRSRGAAANAGKPQQFGSAVRRTRISWRRLLADGVGNAVRGLVPLRFVCDAQTAGFAWLDAQRRGLLAHHRAAPARAPPRRTFRCRATTLRHVLRMRRARAASAGTALLAPAGSFSVLPPFLLPLPSSLSKQWPPAKICSLHSVEVSPHGCMQVNDRILLCYLLPFPALLLVTHMCLPFLTPCCELPLLYLSPLTCLLRRGAGADCLMGGIPHLATFSSRRTPCCLSRVWWFGSGLRDGFRLYCSALCFVPARTVCAREDAERLRRFNARCLCALFCHRFLCTTFFGYFALRLDCVASRRGRNRTGRDCRLPSFPNIAFCLLRWHMYCYTLHHSSAALTSATPLHGRGFLLARLPAYGRGSGFV